MRADRIFAGVAGLAVGFGVLLVTVDVADTDAADGSTPTSTIVGELAATSTSTSTTSTTETTTTTTIVRPTTTTARPTTTTARPTTTTATLPDRTALGVVQFDPRCIGLDLGNGASMTATADGILEWVRERVVDEVNSQGELSESDESALEQAVEAIDLTRCAQVVVELDSDDEENWLCLFGSNVETSGSLSDWTVEQSICLDEPTPSTPTGNSGPFVGSANDNMEGPR